MKWIEFIIVVVVLAALAVVVLGGCQKATVKETYERTPVKARSTGEGVKEYQVYQYRNGAWVPIGDPFVLAIPQQQEVKP